LGSARVLADEQRRSVKPRGQDDVRVDLACPAGQDQEHRLRHVLRIVRVAHLPPGGGEDQVDVPIHQRAERRLIPARHIGA
jgi:hypothetical protein